LLRVLRLSHCRRRKRPWLLCVVLLSVGKPDSTLLGHAPRLSGQRRRICKLLYKRSPANLHSGIHQLRKRLSGMFLSVAVLPKNFLRRGTIAYRRDVEEFRNRDPTAARTGQRPADGSLVLSSQRCASARVTERKSPCGISSSTTLSSSSQLSH
jgi:hypothetical protein